ncbi:hypothetical protein HL667_06950 [Bradyrhizobium sp. 83012]|uniref:AB hydrolase-1 domain-containing protein n=1 Tax=Bradyrhizobium aeschynomenes TaxID=2734909 RepID=A0ABX2C8Z4_9BRAD|nr:hypothetical protein [Bradyrhizobium aeschynomenes]NPU64726.1 hypothetical protein [Bradyrhizobium aeschynomenes]
MTNKRESTLTTYIFVHGTFAAKADWPEVVRALSDDDRLRGHDPKFDEVFWSGRNRFSARRRAAQQISDKLYKIYRANPSEPVFLLGHSHGGSALAYFIKTSPGLALGPAGYVFLSTPFIALREREHSLSLLFALTLLPALVLQPWIGDSVGAGPFYEVFDWIGRLSLLQIAWLFLPPALSSFLMGMTWMALDRFNEALEAQTVDIPKLNALFIRFTGDEAAAALASIQFLSWIGLQISRGMNWVWYPTIVRNKLARRAIGFLLVCFLFALLRAASESQSPLLLSNSSAISLSVILYSAFFIFLIQAIAMWGYGWVSLRFAFAVDLAVEPIPLGARDLVHLDWSSEGKPLPFLLHSWSWAHPAAVVEIVNFCAKGLAEHHREQRSLSIISV